MENTELAPVAILAEAHRGAILSLATTLYARRRLAGAELEDALTAAGVSRAGASPRIVNTRPASGGRRGRPGVAGQSTWDNLRS